LNLAGERVPAMPRGSWKSSFSLLLLIFTLAGAAVSVRAQSSSDDADDEEDAKPTPSLSLNIVFSEDGKAQVSSFAFGQPTTASEIKTVLESSLGCTLHDKKQSRQGSSQFYSGSCEPSFQHTSMVRELRIATAPLRKYALDHQIELLSLAVHLPDVEIRETEPPVQTTAVLSGKCRRACSALRN
jgi:hypothetical protein